LQRAITNKNKYGRKKYRRRLSGCGTFQHFNFRSELDILQRNEILLSAVAQLGHVALLPGGMELGEVTVVVVHNLFVVFADHQQSNIAALVGGALKMGESVHVNQTRADGALALTEAVGVAGAEHEHHIVDDLLKRLNAAGGAFTVGFKRIDGEAEDLKNRSADDGELLLCSFGELELALVHLESHFVKVGGVVAHALDVGDALHEQVYLAAVTLGLNMMAELDEEVGGMVGELVQTVLLFVYLVAYLSFVAVKLLQGHGNIVSGGLGHGDNGISQNAESHGGGVHELGIQRGQLGIFVLLDGVILDDGAAELDKQAGEGNEDDGGHEIENGLEGGYLYVAHDALPEVGEAAGGLDNGHDDHEENSSDSIEHDVHDTGALCVLGRADGADHSGGDAGTEVDTHDKGVDEVEVHGAGGRHGLKNTDHGGRTLNYNGEYETGNDAEEGHIAEITENLHKGVRLGKRLNSVGHQHETGEENAEAQSNESYAVGGLALYKHKENDAQNKGNGSQGVRLEDREQTVAGFDVHKGYDPSGDGGADIGAHNDADSLTESQDARADKTHGEDDGGGGALDDGGDDGTGQNAGQNIAGELAQKVFQSVTGALLKAVAHDLHAVKEQGKTAQQLDYGKYCCHFVFLSCSENIVLWSKYKSLRPLLFYENSNFLQVPYYIGCCKF